MKHIDHYDLIPSYTMKCRLYPNKECAKKIDNAIYAVQSFHNCLLYDIFNGNIESTPKPYKPKKETKPEQKPDESDFDYQNRLYEYEQKQKYKAGDIIHFPNFTKAFSAEYKTKLIEEHPVINEAPQSAITTNVGLVSDIKKSLGKLPIEFQKPIYYSKKHKRESYSYQETLGKITTKENGNVLYINLMKIGTCKIRGWNKNIRFDSSGTIDVVYSDVIETILWNTLKAIVKKRLQSRLRKIIAVIIGFALYYRMYINPQQRLTEKQPELMLEFLTLLSSRTELNMRINDSRTKKKSIWISL